METPASTPPPASTASPAPPAPPSRLLLGLAAALFLAGLALTLYALLHRPDYVVVVGLDRTEQRWLQPRLDRFAEEHHARIALVPWSDRDALLRLLARDRASRRPRVLLADVPFDRLVALVDSGAVLPLSRVKGLGPADEFLAPFEPATLAPGRVGGRPYLVPSRLATCCLYYSKAHVADAVAHWQAMRPAIERWLAEANAQGLPDRYALEADPGQWDSYDVFVVAAYWAAQDVSGTRVARVAHVVAPGDALALDLASRVFALGGQPGDLLEIAGPRLLDALAWESLFFRHGLYHPGMTKERWTASDVLAAVAQGQVWMATLAPRDLLRLRGLAGQDGFVRDANDVGVATMPRGASLLLAQRHPAHTGDSWAARTGYGWGVPAACPDPKLAAALLRALGSEETASDAAQSLGWLPPRTALLDQLDVLYRDRSRFEVARVAARQLYAQGRALPASPRWADAAPRLSRLWEQASVRERLTALPPLVEAMRQAEAPVPGPPARAR